MRLISTSMIAVVVLVAGCGDQQAAAPPESGIAGSVHLGPQCPVETVNNPCKDKPAANVTVTISEQLPGEAYAAGPTVAQTTTDGAGAFRVIVAPGEYVVTAQAGMSCELMDARVSASAYVEVDVPCDTGIR